VGTSGGIQLWQPPGETDFFPLFLVSSAYKWDRLWFLRFLPTGVQIPPPLVSSFHFLGGMGVLCASI